MNEGRKRIAGWAWILVGIGIIAYSKFIESRQPTAKLSLFFWLGIAFVVFGALKEFIPRLMRKNHRKELVGPPQQRAEQEYNTHLHPAGHQQHNVSPHATHQHVQASPHPSHPYEPLHKPCPRCHQMTSGKARYCHNCGHQFF
jgi:hypothetical protein